RADARGGRAGEGAGGSRLRGERLDRVPEPGREKVAWWREVFRPPKPMRPPKPPAPTPRPGTASIVGRVSDEAGAALPGARLTIVEQTTGGAASGSSDAKRRDGFAGVAPGSFALRAEMAGFKNSLTSPFRVEAAHSTQVDVTLRLGSVAEEITVEAEAPTVATNNASTEMTITGFVAGSLPLNGRNFNQL